MRNRETNLKVRDPEIEEEIHGLAKASDPREIWISGKQTLAADSDEIQMVGFAFFFIIVCLDEEQ